MKDNAINIQEAINAINRYRDKTIIIAIHKAVFENKEKIGDVVRDIYFLVKAGINVIIAHSGEKNETEEWIEEAWSGLGPIIFLSNFQEVINYVNIGFIPIVCCKDNGTIFNSIITGFALDIGAVKVVYITSSNGIFSERGEIIGDVDIEMASDLIQKKIISGNMLHIVEAAMTACSQSQIRFHIIGTGENALLKEILSVEGSGTMIYDRVYKEFRFGKKSDAYDLYEIIASSAKKTSIALSYIKKNIEQFIVYTIDERPYGCVAITDSDNGLVEISYLCSEDQLILRNLLEHALKNIPKNIEYVFLDADKSSIWLSLYPWFKQLGFKKYQQVEYDLPIKKGGNVYFKKM